MISYIHEKGLKKSRAALEVSIKISVMINKICNTKASL